MAYAALLSLSKVLEHSLIHDELPLPVKKEKLVSLQGNVTTMLTWLEAELCKEAANLLESQIIDAAYQAEDIIESRILSMACSASDTVTESIDFDMVLHESDSILDEITKGKKRSNTTATQSNPSPDCSDDLASLSTALTLDDATMIGFDDDFLAIKKIMYQQSSCLEIIPILGMGGIGKSTLAKRLYEDSFRAQYFDRHAWIVVSQEFSLTELLMQLLRCIIKHTDNLFKKTDSQLAEYAYKELIGRRYLIVLDDVWSTGVWDALRRIFPKGADGSRVLLTTRLSDIATYIGSDSVLPHELHLLSDDQSWRLLEERVFGNEHCPQELQQIGKKIAKNCRGLPLIVVVVASLLKGNMTKEYWESVSENISSAEPTIAEQCSKVLFLSYDSLPLYLKPCFLYVAAFPEDSGINVSRLIRLWVAEGFIRSSGSKLLEDVARGYLDDLVGRSLLLVGKKIYDGRIKTVGIHDILRDVGSLKAQEERFHYHGLGSSDGEERRLSIHTHNSLAHLSDIHHPVTRSLLVFFTERSKSSTSILNFGLLRILDAPPMAPLKVEPQNLQLLRYLAFKYDGLELPKSVSKLQNLQTLVIYAKSMFPLLHMPLEIWKMPSVRHLIVSAGCHFEQPSEYETVEETNLQTLLLAIDFSITTQTTKMLANIRKLGLYYIMVGEHDWTNFELNNLVHLQKLEEFIMISEGQFWPGIMSAGFAFPCSLKKLNLTSFRGPWEDMNILGSLPNLEVIKLRGWSSDEGVWNPVEDQFQKLRYLELSQVYLCSWGVQSTHFPRLQIIMFKYMGDSRAPLEDIPSDVGELKSLKLIELRYCKPSIVDSAKQIQSEQQDMGNEDLQVRVIG